MSWQLVRRDLLGVKKHLFQRTEEPGGIREPLDECARNYTNVVPSVMALEEEELELISEAMEVHQEPPNWEPIGAGRGSWLVTRIRRTSTWRRCCRGRMCLPACFSSRRSGVGSDEVRLKRDFCVQKGISLKPVRNASNAPND